MIHLCISNSFLNKSADFRNDISDFREYKESFSGEFSADQRLTRLDRPPVYILYKVKGFDCQLIRKNLRFLLVKIGK